MTTSAARGPAIIAEAGGVGQLMPDAVELLVAGVGRSLRWLGMLPGSDSVPVRVLGEHRFVYGRTAGWWESAVTVGAEVLSGELLGVIKDLWGEVVEEVAAPQDGVVLWQTTSPAVGSEGLLLGIA
jgi:predicted deacylase